MKTTPTRQPRWSKFPNKKRLQRDALESGCSKSQRSLAAALLALQPGHNAATPTWTRQGSLVSADALPTTLGLLSSPSHGFT